MRYMRLNFYANSSIVLVDKTNAPYIAFTIFLNVLILGLST